MVYSYYRYRYCYEGTQRVFSMYVGMVVVNPQKIDEELSGYLRAYASNPKIRYNDAFRR